MTLSKKFFVFGLAALFDGKEKFVKLIILQKYVLD